MATIKSFKADALSVVVSECNLGIDWHPIQVESVLLVVASHYGNQDLTSSLLFFSKEIEENFLLMEDEGDDIALDDLGSESAQYFPVDSEGMEEMVSYTEHARINAWKTPEVIKKAAEKGVPSRVGSATTRVNSISAAHPPPQRPSSPTQPGVVPFIQANRWLAGGRDVSSASVKRASVPLPGWMEGLEERRPKSSPAMRGPR